jgi:transposase
VMLDLIVEHQAGIPVLMRPLSGNRSDAQDFGDIIRAHIEQLQTTYGTTYLVADSALYSADNLQKLAETRMKWITRVPATLSDAQAAFAHAEPETMMPLLADDRYQTLPSSYGGVEQRWMLVYSEHRRAQAMRTVNAQWLTQSEKESQAFKKLCRTTFACQADAQQALAAFEQA